MGEGGTMSGRVVQIHLSVERLDDLLRGRLPAGVRVVAVDRQLWDGGIRLLLESETFPERSPGVMPPDGWVRWELNADFSVRIVEVKVP